MHDTGDVLLLLLVALTALLGCAHADGDNEELYEFFPDHSVESLCNLFERMGGGREGDSAPKALITVTQLAQSQSAKLSAKVSFAFSLASLASHALLGSVSDVRGPARVPGSWARRSSNRGAR